MASRWAVARARVRRLWRFGGRTAGIGPVIGRGSGADHNGADRHIDVAALDSAANPGTVSHERAPAVAGRRSRGGRPGTGRSDGYRRGRTDHRSRPRSDGRAEVPEDFDETGWWTGGPEPGEQGPAIIAGHIDSKRGPAVFYRLHELQPSDAVRVTRADGSRVEFTVRRTEQHAKAAFPTEIVYARPPGRSCA